MCVIRGAREAGRSARGESTHTARLARPPPEKRDKLRAHGNAGVQQVYVGIFLHGGCHLADLLKQEDPCICRIGLFSVMSMGTRWVTS